MRQREKEERETETGRQRILPVIMADNVKKETRPMVSQKLIMSL